MEVEAVVNDTLRQNGLPESEMINRDKHGAVVELAKRGTPKKAIASRWSTQPSRVTLMLKVNRPISANSS